MSCRCCWVIADTALETFLASLPVLTDDYLHMSIRTQAGVLYEFCAQRPDWYRDRYLSLAATGGTDFSGPWDRWYAHQFQGWTGPFTGAYQNSFGYDCGGPFSWCSELGLGPGAVAVLPADTFNCESAELASGCGNGDWILRVGFGAGRLAACGF